MALHPQDHSQNEHSRDVDEVMEDLTRLFRSARASSTRAVQRYRTAGGTRGRGRRARTAQGARRNIGAAPNHLSSGARPLAVEDRSVEALRARHTAEREELIARVAAAEAVAAMLRADAEQAQRNDLVSARDAAQSAEIADRWAQAWQERARDNNIDLPSPEPDSAEPDSAEPGSAEPGVAEPDSAEPGTAQRADADLAAQQPESAVERIAQLAAYFAVDDYELATEHSGRSIGDVVADAWPEGVAPPLSPSGGAEVDTSAQLAPVLNLDSPQVGL